MKKLTFKMMLFLVFIGLNTFAQTSTKTFSFQGYAIDPDGKALAASSVMVKFTITDNGNPTSNYSEEQTLTTDAYGVFTAQVGSVTSNNFKKLNFTAKNADYWLKVEVKKTSGGVYTIIQNARMSAVPYARYADNGVPVGTIVPFAGEASKIPDGWLLCDGTAYSNSDPAYTQLFNVIGYNWGKSGATDFRVPDLRGYFLRGVSGTATTDEDKNARTIPTGSSLTSNDVGTKQTEGYHVHNHTLTDPQHSHPYNDMYYSEVGGAVTVPGNRGSSGTDSDNAGFQIARTTSTSSSGISIADSGISETRPDNAYVHYIIKY